MELIDYITETAKAAKEAFYSLSAVNPAQKNHALSLMAEGIIANSENILKANDLDVQCARKKGLAAALLDRLQLTEKNIQSMADGILQVVALPDPVGEMDGFRTLPSGITLGKMRVPLGVIGIIYESRPNVTLDAAILCLKSGNSCVLRGGSEAINSNKAIAKVIHSALIQADIPTAAINLITETDRAGVDIMLQLPQYIDVIIPRGGKGLVQRINEKARVPVIKHLDGICHVYIDEDADKDMAIKIAVNAKISRYGTCNTMETLLVHQSQAKEVLPLLQVKYAEK